jgi:two-component system sensor histidine kinase QseC
MQAHLLTLVLGFSMAVWLGAATITWYDASHEVDELLDGHLAQAAALLSVQADGDDDDIADAPVLHRYAPRVGFQVFIGGQLITRTTNVGKMPMAEVTDGFSTVTLGQGERWRVFATYIAARGVQVFVGEKTESRQAILWAVMRSMLGPLFLALPLLALAGFWSVKRGLAPLRQLSIAVAKRAPNADVPLNTKDLPTELRPLAQALNTLFERIGRMVELERRFTADAAHELRTPIAAIRAQAQVALAAGEDDAQRTHALQSTLEGCDRASRLVDQLLTLARLETSMSATAVEVDITKVARHAVAQLAPSALARQQLLELHADTAVLQQVDDALLSVLIRNLLDNALRYSPPGTDIRMEVSSTDGSARLLVEDGGPGMTDTQLQRLGERFYRVIGNDASGSGLGWSIIHRVVTAFGAHITVDRSKRLGGLSVEVRWPRRGA